MFKDFYSIENKSKPGYLKSETKEKLITHYCALKKKMYSMTLAEPQLSIENLIKEGICQCRVPEGLVHSCGLNPTLKSKQ